MVMIRPRESGFCYDNTEFATMCRDAQAALELGADGIVFGVLHADGTIDAARCRTLKELAEGRETVFHRAFDLTADPQLALDRLIDLGITRVLTSGQQPTAIRGADLIRRLIERANRKIEILPGGGLDEHNVADFLDRTGCEQVHLGLSTHRSDPTLAADAAVQLVALEHSSQGLYRTLHPERLRSLVQALSASSPVRTA
jgi:copper homeostasis protein